MKDYYKILGVKENASDEEIRNRWIELTKHYHPDRTARREVRNSHQRIREINEAYQVLKHSSTRVEFDLKRTYGYEKREEERRARYRRVGISASLLIVFIALAGFYLKDDKSPSSELTLSKKINSKGPMNFQTLINQENQSRLSPSESIQSERLKPFSRNQISTPSAMLQMNQPLQASAAIRVNPVGPGPSPTLDTPIRSDDRPPFSPPIDPLAQTAEIQTPTDPATIASATPAIEMPPSPSTLMIPPEIKTLQPKEPIYSIHVEDPIIELAQVKPPPLLATEEEVKRFFDSYLEAYQRMDIEGFLSLFSSKAIQNGKDRMEGIRKIYADFFNQGKEVHYRMKEMRVEIYQNGIEVKAHYEIEQTLKKRDEKKVWRGLVRWVLGKENNSLKIISLDYQHQKTS